MINTVEKLRVNLKLFKLQAKKADATEFQYYPMFCVYLDKNLDKYDLPKHVILDEACNILI